MVQILLRQLSSASATFRKLLLSDLIPAEEAAQNSFRCAPLNLNGFNHQQEFTVTSVSGRTTSSYCVKVLMIEEMPPHT